MRIRAAIILVVSVGVGLATSSVSAQYIYWGEFWGGQDSIQRGDGGGVLSQATFFQETDDAAVTRAIALDAVGGKMYWAKFGEGIFRGNLDGSGTVEELLEFYNLSQVRDLALDPTAGKMYWIEAAGDIRRGNMDGTGAPESVYTPLDEIALANGIALDVAAGKIYLTDLDTIKIGNMDGTGELLELYDQLDGLDEPKDIELDIPGGMLYWSEAFGRIKRAAMDGLGTPEVLIFELNEVPDLVLDLGRKKMYWTVPTTKRLRSANMDGSGSAFTMYDSGNGVTAPHAIAMMPFPASPALGVARSRGLMLTGLLVLAGGLLQAWRIRRLGKRNDV